MGDWNDSKRVWDDRKLCRDVVYVDGGIDNPQDVADKVINKGHEGFISNCLNDFNSSEYDNLKNYMSNYPTTWKDETSTLGHYWCLPTQKKVKYKRIYPYQNTTEGKLHCCEQYKKGSQDIDDWKKCDPYTCSGNQKCDDTMATTCSKHIIPDSLIQSFKNGELVGMKETIEDISNLLEKPECDTWYKNTIEANKIKYNNNLKPLIIIILNKLEDENLTIETRKQIINLLTSTSIKNVAKYNSEMIKTALNKFCNNEKIFNKDANWVELNDIYGPICNCYWDSKINNGNPVYKERENIKKIKDLDGLSDELRSYLQISSDIEPTGEPYCWYDKCTGSSGLKPEWDVNCPNMNIASCLSHINFKNDGNIISENVSLIAECSAKINSKKFKLGDIDIEDVTSCSYANYPLLDEPDPEFEKKYKNYCNNELKDKFDGGCEYCDNISSCVQKKNMGSNKCGNIKDNNKTNNCFLTGFEDKSYLEKQCETYNCDWCSDLDKYMISEDFKGLKTLSCENNDINKENLKHKCNEIKKRSKDEKSCDWCFNIDKYIKDNTLPGPGPGPEPSPTLTNKNKKSGLSKTWIIVIVIAIVIILIIVIIAIYYSSSSNTIPKPINAINYNQ